MRIRITARPTFEIPMTLWEVEKLIELSETHYDAVCKSISKPGGFLYGWRNRLSAPVCWNSVDATHHELDILLKVCEGMGYMHVDTRDKLQTLCNAIHGAMRCAEKQLSHWSYSYEAK